MLGTEKVQCPSRSINVFLFLPTMPAPNTAAPRPWCCQQWQPSHLKVGTKVHFYGHSPDQYPRMQQKPTLISNQVQEGFVPRLPQKSEGGTLIFLKWYSLLYILNGVHQ